MKRHSADVTADRLERLYDRYEDRLSAIDLANMRDTIRALRRIASDDRYGTRRADA